MFLAKLRHVFKVRLSTAIYTAGLVKSIRTISQANLNNLAERIAAAYVSYIRGHRGIDVTLRTIRGRKLGQFWLSAADTVFTAVGAREGSILRLEGLFDNASESNRDGKRKPASPRHSKSG